MSADQGTVDAATLRVPGSRGGDEAAEVPHARIYLQVFCGERATSFALPRSGTVTIGRALEAALRLDDHGVSRRHAVLTMRDGEAEIADLGSHNGVWIGDERVVTSRVLVAGDVITVGGATLIYHADACRFLRVGEVEVVIAEPAMLRLFAVAERIAAGDLPVLITGETGTGKELVAAAIHGMSARAGGPFVVMGCAALPEDLLESELFGCAAGADPGRGPARPGRLEAAAGGTLFLDEIGELSPAAQVRLLRAIEAGRVVRVGERGERALDLRIIAATHHPIDDEVEAGTFRRDLYFRLGGARLSLPPLRERPRELPILAQHFLSAAARAIDGGPRTISAAAMRALVAHTWPGNVRELRNLMTYAAAAFPGETLQVEHLAERLPPAVSAAPGATAAASVVASSSSSSSLPAEAAPTFRPLEDEIRELEVDRIRAALAATGGNQTRAAELIGMPLRTFVNKLKRYGLGADRRP